MSAPPAQKLLAAVLTAMLFALIVFGLGAAFASFGHRAWGHLVGIGCCVVMVIAGLATSRRDH